MNLSDLFGGEAPVWVSGRTYAGGQVARDPADWYFRYVRVAGGAGTTNPINDLGNWRPDGGRPIKSTQRGVINIPNGSTIATATISAVITSKTQLRMMGGSGLNSGGYLIVPRVELTNSTTITAVCSFVAAGNALVGWELTEYY